MRGKHNVRGGLALAGVRVRVSRDKSAALPRYERAAVFGFSDRFVTRGKVDYNVCAGKCVTLRRLHGTPKDPRIFRRRPKNSAYPRRGK